MDGPVTDQRLRALATRAMEIHRMEGKRVPLAVHIVCDGNESLKTQVHAHLQYRRRSKRQKECGMGTKKDSSKTVKAKTARKPATKRKPKMAGLLGYQATYVGGTALVVDKVMSWLKADKVKQICIPVGHYPYVGGHVADAAAAAGIKVSVLSPIAEGWSNFRDETKKRLVALLESSNGEYVHLEMENVDPKDAKVYREVARRIAHNSEYVVALTNTPRTMDDLRIAIEEGCTIRPINVRKLRKHIETAKAKLEASVAAEMQSVDF